MKKKPIIYAFIDSQNLNLAIRDMGWKLDFARFRVYLREKLQVEKAYLFLGYIPENKDMYSFLRKAGFDCIFRPTLAYKDGTTKGNCDAELVLQAMIDFNVYDQAVVVTGDGDFYCLANHLIKNNKLKTLLVPNRHKYSALLKLKLFRPFTRDMNDLRKKLEYLSPKKKNPLKDETLKGTSSAGDTKRILANERPRVKIGNKKTRSSGRITSLGQPGHGDIKSTTKRSPKIKRPKL
ncbi:MAG: NYN domain-containing protein [Candidatus Saccharimonadales bacterium]